MCDVIYVTDRPFEGTFINDVKQGEGGLKTLFKCDLEGKGSKSSNLHGVIFGCSLT